MPELPEVESARRAALAVEYATSRAVALPQTPHPTLGTVFRRSAP